MVVAILVLLVSLYLVVNYQHPEDKNQAWIPKIVVLLGLTVAFWTILLFPLDVANQQSCELDIPLSSCDTTLPMTQLWYAVYIANMAITFIAVPFAIFYYEADSDWCAAAAAGGGLGAAVWQPRAACVPGRLLLSMWLLRGCPLHVAAPAAATPRRSLALPPAAAGASRGAC